MKKSFWSYLVIVLALFISCYWLGKKSRPVAVQAEAESAPITPAKTTQATADSESAAQPVASANRTSRPAIVRQTSWQNLQGGELYSALFDNKAFTAFGNEDLTQVRARFTQTYPTQPALYKAMLMERLGILKALEQQVPLHRAPSAVLAPELRGFYAQVLASPQENWLVKRQAFRNLHTALSETEKEAYYRTLDSKVVSMAASSEQELVEGVLSETH